MSVTGLPEHLGAERFVLGSIMLDATHYPVVAGMLAPDDFSLEKHRRIFRAMSDVVSSGEALDRITVANALKRRGELESVDGLSYLISLDDGLPQIPNVEAYVRMVRDKAILRSIVFAAHHLEAAAMAPDAEPAALLAETGTSLLGLAERGAETTLHSAAAIIEAGGGMSAYLDRKAGATGTPSGYGSFDALTGGFKAGGLYVLAARPAMGKSSLAMNIAERVGVDGESIVPVFSLEMDKESLVDRMICSRARVNTKRFDGGYMDSDEKRRAWKAAGEIAAEERVLIDDRANTNTQEIHAKIRKQQARGSVGLVIIDYLQLLIDGDDAHRVAAASRISRELKLIAKDCKVPVLALSQLSRVCETRSDKRPILSDLRETGAIEQDSDLVMMLYREEVYTADREDLRGLAELIVRKHRGGPIGMLPMVWIGEIVRFEEMAREGYDGDGA